MTLFYSGHYTFERPTNLTASCVSEEAWAEDAWAEEACALEACAEEAWAADAWAEEAWAADAWAWEAWAEEARALDTCWDCLFTSSIKAGISTRSADN